MHATVVVLTKLPDHLPVKTRLVPVLGEQGARDFYLEMLHETLELVPGAIVAYSPPDAETDLPNARPVQGDDGATCLENALADAYEGKPLVALGGDAPDLPRERIEQAVAALADFDAVFVSTPDGGFSCLALRQPIDGLAKGFTYGGGDTLTRLRTFFESKGLKTTNLEPWRDIDTPDDLIDYRDRQFEPTGSFLLRRGPGDTKSYKKLCFAATDRAFLVNTLYLLTTEPECHVVKYRPAPRDGMYSGRAFMTTDEAAGRTWRRFHGHPKTLCTLQDDGFVEGFRG